MNSILSHLSGKDVTVTFSNTIKGTKQSASITVYDGAEVQLVQYTLTADDLDKQSFSYTIDSSFNTLPDGSGREARQVEYVIVDTDGNEHSSEMFYLVERKSYVKAGENSLMTFAESLALVPDIPSLKVWHSRPMADKKAALLESFRNLSRFYIKDSYQVDGINRITNYTVDQYSELDASMIRDFRIAQILEAEAILGGDMATEMRDKGVISRSVGESTTFFRTSKPLQNGIDARAYKYISRYVTRDVKLGRA